MQKNIRNSYLYIFLLIGAVMLSSNAFARPVLLELFTSEGCSACPAGERKVAELNKRDDFFALSFHVDYWDKKGWVDKFAKREFTDRQMAYMSQFGSSKLYTPQAVVDGVNDTYASWGWRVKMLAHGAKKKQVAIPIELNGNKVHLEAVNLPKLVDIWYVTYNDYEESNVKAGANAGEVLGSVNVVHTLNKLALWDGKAVTINLPKLEGTGEKTAIFIQEQHQGKVLGLYHQ